MWISAHLIFGVTLSAVGTESLYTSCTTRIEKITIKTTQELKKNGKTADDDDEKGFDH